MKRISDANMVHAVRQLVIGVLVYVLAVIPAFGQATLLPNARQQFFDSNGNPLSMGTVDFFIPNTGSRKNTWRNAEQTVLNTNPVQLDAGGWATIYGAGSYRQVVKDVNGVPIWDAITSSTGSGGGGGGGGTGDGLAVGTVLPFYGLVPPSGYAFTYGQAVSRVTFSDLLSAITISATVTCSLGSNIIGGFTSTEQVRVGAPIEAACLAPGTTVATINSPTSVTASNNAITSISTLGRIFPYGNGDGATTFNVPDLRGRVMPGRDNMGGVAANTITNTFYGAAATALGVPGGAQSTTLITGNLPAYTPSGTVNITDPGHSHNYGSSIQGAMFQGGGNGSWATTITNSQTTTTVGTGITAAFVGAAQGGTSAAFSRLPPGLTTNYIIKVSPNGGASVVADIGGQTGSIACGLGILCSNQEIAADIDGLPAMVGPVDDLNDELMIFDASLGLLRKTTPAAILAGFSSAVASVTAGNGTLSISPNTGAVFAQLNLSNANTWVGAQTFAPTGLLVQGASSGTLSLRAAATAGSSVFTFPAGTTDLSATGGTGQVLRQSSLGGAITVGTIACSDLTDDGAFCSSTDAANLTGTVASARISGAYAGLSGTGTLTSGATGPGFTVSLATSTLTGTVPNANLPTATSGALGISRPDNSTITVTGGVLSAVGGVATDVNVGVTTVTGSTPDFLLYNNAGVLGNRSIASILTSGTGISVTGTTNATINIVKANNGNIFAGTSNTVITADGVAAVGSFATLTPAATIAVDMATGINFVVTLNQASTLGAPTNTQIGRCGQILINQDPSTPRTLAFNAVWKFAGGVAPAVTATVNARDFLNYCVITSSFITATMMSDVK